MLPLAALPTLTPTESDVMRLVAAGFENDEIAARLTVPRHTVTATVKTVRLKLKARNRVELVLIYLGLPVGGAVSYCPANIQRKPLAWYPVA